MRIPRRLNTVWDWWSQSVWQPAVAHPGAGLSTALTVGSLLAIPFLPAVAAGLVCVAAGVLAGWNLRVGQAVEMQAQLDASEREVGRLGHLLREAVSGRVEDSAIATVHLPRIGGGR